MAPRELPFHILVSKWFEENIGFPTDVQIQAWAQIAENRNVLITAPTGSGKTLAAFLWAINQMVDGKWKSGCTNVLYVSPLKALNNDIQRNLSKPLDELGRIFNENKEVFPAIRVMTRSGDTSQSDRRRMIRHPPEILITTPESLNLLISSKTGRLVLNQIKTVILDEIHSVVGNKRGVHLITAVDRLVGLSGEFQRIALSATVRPLEKVAEFVAGRRVTGDILNPEYTPRDISIVESAGKKEYRLEVSFPEGAVKRGEQEPVWDSITEECRRIISRNTSTLIFTNSRRLCEKITHMINQGVEFPIAWAHHGSLSREIRTEVEHRLKAGELKAIVATSSLEMGIDIGDLDEVILVQSPKTVSSAIQRIGRAGHQVGKASRCTLFPSHPQDFIDAAVLAKAVTAGDIEAVRPVECPLDVLSQVIISMAGAEIWDIDELFMWIRAGYPYRELSRTQFDLVINMLAGRYNSGRIRELKPRVSIDRIDNTITAGKGALLTLFMSGGTIPDRGYYHLRHQETGALIGDLDEEYVWESNPGQLVTFGTQNWKIQRITHNDVFVTPAKSGLMDTPFWRGDELNRDFHFSKRIACFLEKANEMLYREDFEEILKSNYYMDDVSASQLKKFLENQREYTGTDLPHRHHILLEFINSGPSGTPGRQAVIHTMWGGRLNRPLAMAMDEAWKIKYGRSPEIFSGNDCIVIQLSEEGRPEDLLTLVTSESVEALIRKKLELSGFFGARFRECAGRALLVTREKVNQRMPLWMTRMRSKKLLEEVIGYDDFPILLETWRTCLKDEFDIENLKTVLNEIESGIIRQTVTYTEHPSPFAAGISWNQISRYMYEPDQPSITESSVREDLLQEVVFSPEKRPGIPLDIIRNFELKRQRLSQGYAPQDLRELIDWVKERILIPRNEWNDLLNAMERDSGFSFDAVAEKTSDKLAFVSLPGTDTESAASLEIVHGLYRISGNAEIDLNIELMSGGRLAILPDKVKNLPPDKSEEEWLADFVGEWLTFYGPVSMGLIHSVFGKKEEDLHTVLDSLLESKDIIYGCLIAGSGDEFYCDSKNFETLLRLKRSGAAPQFEALEAKYLSLLLSSFHGMTKKTDSIDGLFRTMEQLMCLPLPAELWETDLLPARFHHYQCLWLDTLMREGDMRWLGFENKRVAFIFESDLDLIKNGSVENGKPDTNNPEAEQRDLVDITGYFPDSRGKYDFMSLMELSGKGSEVLSEMLWDAVWQGRIANDTFAALRKGIETGFRVHSMSKQESTRSRLKRGGAGRTGFSRWKGSLPYAGNWFRISEFEKNEDLLDLEDLKRERVRLLLERYGFLCRELLQREPGMFRWNELFRSMRLMELSGELLGGYFFKGVSGPQFISHRAFGLLQRLSDEESHVYWVNANDPVSLCGTGIDAAREKLPRRVPGNHLVYKGIKLVLVSKRYGSSLTINAPPGDPQISEYFCSIDHMLNREFRPVKYVSIETVNGVNAVNSPYIDAFKKSFDVMLDHRTVTLYKKR